METTEEYNGSAWSVGGDLGTARRVLAAAGTQTAGLCFGGFSDAVSAVTEEYDGAAWSAGGNLSTARYALAGAGSQGAGLSIGGYTTARVKVTEEYDGAAWSAGGNLSVAKSDMAGAGDQGAGLSCGGFTTTYSATTEEYDGSAWSAGGNLSTARNNLAACGTQIAALSFGGHTSDGESAITEEYAAEQGIDIIGIRSLPKQDVLLVLESLVESFETRNPDVLATVLDDLFPAPLYTKIQRFDENFIPKTLINSSLNIIAKASFGFGDVNGCVIFKKYNN
jgi:hypothetical protein